jgi:Fe-S-cluster containining protein
MLQAVRPTGICRTYPNMIGNDQQEEPNFKPLVDQMQTMLQSYLLHD